jgi:hypothetical protein
MFTEFSTLIFPKKNHCYDDGTEYDVFSWYLHILGGISVTRQPNSSTREAGEARNDQGTNDLENL